MDVKIVSTGRVFYQIDNAVAALLMEMFPAAIERANPKPAPTAPTAAWGINVTPSGYQHVIFKLGDRTEFYDGPPSGLTSHFQKMGVVVPDHIAERYKSLWKPREFEHPSVQAAYWAEYEAIHK